MQAPHDPLDPLLERWRTTPFPPPGAIADEAWRRIAIAETTASPSKLERMAAAFVRPSFAAAFVAACILLGLFLAEVRLSRLAAERNAQLARSYLQLIDPLLASAPSRATTVASRR